MRKFIYFICLFVTGLFVNAQSAEGRYLSRMTDKGYLYFLMPHKLDKISGINKFEYDITCLNWSDTVTVNFTFRSKYMSLPDDIEIVSGDNTYKCINRSALFIDIVSKGYEIRVTSSFLFSDIYHAFMNEIAPEFRFSQNGIMESATYKHGAWKKDRKKLVDIFNLINYSK